VPLLLLSFPTRRSSDLKPSSMFEMIESFASSICFQSLWFLTSRGLFKIAETAPHSSCALEYMGKSSSVFAMQPSSARLMPRGTRSEEHTSELQSPYALV